MASAERMIPFISKWEGGYSDHPDDKGGCTMAGVTIGTYRNYYGQEKTCDDLRFITHKEWLRIFKNGYWDKFKADKIENQSIAQLCVDMAWGSGPTTAIRRVQRLFGLKVDGIVGRQTLAALNAPDRDKTFALLWDMRRKWLIEISKKGNNKVFLKGWLRRLDDIKFIPDGE